MDTVVFILQIVAATYLASVGPAVLHALIRGSIHDRQYIFDWIDVASGVSAVFLLVFGLPAL